MCCEKWYELGRPSWSWHMILGQDKVMAAAGSGTHSVWVIASKLEFSTLFNNACVMWRVFENCAGGVSNLFIRQVAKQNEGLTTAKISSEVRSFTLTLNFYSHHTYPFVVKTFDTRLAHLRTLEKWFQSIHVMPGVAEPAFSAINVRDDVASLKGNLLYVH